MTPTDAARQYAEALGLTLSVDRGARALKKGPGRYAARVRALIGHLLRIDPRRFPLTEIAAGMGYASVSGLQYAVRGYEPRGRPRKARTARRRESTAALVPDEDLDCLRPLGRSVGAIEEDGVGCGYDPMAW